MNLMMLLEMAAAGMGERVAVQCEQARWTHAELFEGAGRLATLLRASRAERVSVLDVSSPAVPLALFASKVHPENFQSEDFQTPRVQSWRYSTELF
jgi:acyl-CoA synthetase (AMP-forming)/AMP-acid ligase II